MGKVDLRLDHQGMAEVLNSGPVSNEINSLGSRVHSSVSGVTYKGEELPVVKTGRVASGARLTSRPAIDVMIKHRYGLTVEASSGPLARAAMAAGLEFTSQGGAA